MEGGDGESSAGTKKDGEPGGYAPYWEKENVATVFTNAVIITFSTDKFDKGHKRAVCSISSISIFTLAVSVGCRHSCLVLGSLTPTEEISLSHAT